MKKTLCIADVEAAYSNQFMEVINAKKTCPFIVYAFTSAETLRAFLRTETADVILISPDYYGEDLRTMTDAQVFLLMSGREQKIPERIPLLSKYQKAEEIVRLVLKQYEISCPGYRQGDGGTELIGIYSPLHRIGKTSFALALGQELARDKKVLYLNLEGCSGFSQLFRREYSVDLTDLLYYARQERGMMLSQLASITCSFHDMDYVPPARVPVELTDIAEEEWSYLIDQLIGSGLYEVIIIDFGEGIRGLLGLLSRCDRIYTPVAVDRFSAGKLEQYEDMLELLDYSEISERMRKIVLPRCEAVMEDTFCTESLHWSPYSNYVRQLLAGEMG